MPFIGEAHGDAVLRERPHFLDEPIVELARPFAAQKRLDRIAALKKFGAVAPAAVGRIGAGDADRVARIPGILGGARLLRGSLARKRRQWRTRRHRHAPVILAGQTDDNEVASLPLSR